MIRIRPFRAPADYQALAPLLGTTVDRLDAEDAALPATDALTTGPDGRLTGHGRIRLLAEDRTGRPVGYATAWRAPWTPPGDLASHYALATPDVQPPPAATDVLPPPAGVPATACTRIPRAGTLTSTDVLLPLADALTTWARTAGATRLLTELPDTRLDALPALLDRGHTVDAHIRTASTTLRPSPAPLPEPPAGIRFTTLATTTVTDPAQRLHALYLATLPDNPGFADALPDYEQWHTEVLAGPAFRPDWIHLAEHTGRLVAVAAAHATPDPYTCHLTYAAVARPWRGRGLARTLKLHATDHLAHAGLRTAHTEVAAANTPMTALTTALGYTWHPGHHRLVLPL
ncbi:GNAT family N-acetyltransferase [Kitasatospora terrestris]|uniref:N-acetyltransferase domain-containing protein n=1 Tax=Kitasatospora terrestris TaxID=258051 RepID=A0ABP9DLA8_9ACTN